MNLKRRRAKKMDLKRTSIESLFHCVPIHQVFNHLKNSSKILEFEDFYAVTLDEFRKYSKDDVEKIYGFLEEILDFNDCSTFFFQLGKYCDKILLYDEYEPKIQYDKLMTWTMMSHYLGQDLPAMCFLAYRDYQYEDHTDFFAYRSVIRTDNKRLQNILAKGIAENHFHLKGSTRVFDINWISLMNHPFHREREFEAFKYKMNREKIYKDSERYSLYTLVKLAALIRMYLFLLINNLIGKEDYKNQIIRLICSDLDDIDTKDVFKILVQGHMLVNFSKEIDLDYALKEGMNYRNFNDNFILSGERRLMYECIYRAFIKNLDIDDMILFYIYIIIKGKFRDEIVQINSRVGFENFSTYEKRKEIFVEDYPKYKNELIRLAVVNTCIDQNVTSLEARITPKDNAQRNIQQIRNIDRLLGVKNNSIKFGNRETEFFYVYHFVKKKEIEKYNDISGIIQPRNINVRKETEIKAKALAEGFKTNTYFRERVRGIDACNNEFFCRPEAFAQAFRFLKGLNFTTKTNLLEEQHPVIINTTYHAGEDFFDIIDGLRSIDEAILFCNLDNQSRIGHAIALGIDIDDYYKNKDRIAMTNQDFLDNIAWMISKCVEYDIDIETSYLNKLKSDFSTVFNKVYVCDTTNSNDILGENLVCSNITIDEYYDAWMLRGDNPELYRKVKIVEIDEFSKYNMFAYNQKIPNENIRNNERIRCLYNAYHFNEHVRREGNKKFFYKINGQYIDLVKKIQKKMQFSLSYKGIMIECNPTSNFKIAQLEKYSAHPIIKFYNYDLKQIHDDECAQLCASINTDDQGVFDTSLENEYALMAYALEHDADDKGKRTYTPTEVYNWINSVRNMGLQQKFR